MTDVAIISQSLDDLPKASRQRLRNFLDSADSANPYQDPEFFGGRDADEMNLLVERDGRPIFFALGNENAALTRFLPGLRTLVVHKGPVADDPDALMSGLQALKEFGRKKKLCEILINPQIDEKHARDVTQICRALGFNAVAALSPTMTLILDVTRDLDQITAGFHKGTRYEVNRALRLGMIVKRAKAKADFLRFFKIHSQRASQKGFVTLSVADFSALSERMLAFPERGAVFLSEFHGDTLAGAVLLRAGSRVHYLYGATDSASAGNLPGLYPVFRRAIEWTKEIGCTELDFGGYGPSGVPSVRRFKEGFGGEPRVFGPTYRLTLNPLVSRLTQAVRLFRS